MAVTLQVFLVLGILCYFAAIIYFLRNKSLTLKYSLLWLITGVVMFLAVIFPSTIEQLAKLVGIASVTNAVFALELFFLMIILMSITSIVSKQNEKIKKLIQHVALLEKKVVDSDQAPSKKFEIDLLASELSACELSTGELTQETQTHTSAKE